MERKSKRKTKCKTNKRRKHERQRQNEHMVGYQHCPGSSFLLNTSKLSAHKASHTCTSISSSSNHGNIASGSILSAYSTSGLVAHGSSKTSKASKKIKLKKRFKIKRLRKTKSSKKSMDDPSHKCGKQSAMSQSRDSESAEEDGSSTEHISRFSTKRKDGMKGIHHSTGSASERYPPSKRNESGRSPSRYGDTQIHQDNNRGHNLGLNQCGRKGDYQGSHGGSSYQGSGKGSPHRKKKTEYYANDQQGGSSTGNYHHNRGGRSGGWSENTYPSGCQTGRGRGSSKSVPQVTATSTSQSGASSSLEIPGFYYDPEKKRYFKIQESGGNPGEDFITKESIAKAKAESQRQRDLQSLHEKIATKHTVPAASTCKTLRKSPSQSLFSLLLNGFQRGEVSTARLRRTWVLGLAANLRQTGSCHVFAIPEFHQNLEHMMQMEASKESDKLLCLWSLTGTLVERLQLVTINGNRRTYPDELALDFSSSDTTVLQSWNKITNVCWSDFKQFPDKKYVLYTTRCHTGRTQSLAFIRNLDPSSQDEVCFFDFNLGSQMTWTCSWNYQKQQFGVGTEKGCLVIDINTRRLWQFKTNKSDALAQIFTKEDGGNTMYTGTRRGSILKHDLRSSSTQPIHLMSHPTSVVCLRLSPDETYLYASDFSGNIKNWDLRMNKVVLTYKGLFNMQSKLPFHIDETQSLLYGAGQDCYTKIWCLQSGRLLHSIPPPYEASLYSIPAVQFSPCWAGVEGNVGLIMGAHKSFFLYGPSSQND